MTDIIEQYKSYNPTPENSQTIITIISKKNNIEEWQILEALVLAGEYISPAANVKAKSKETAQDIIRDIQDMSRDKNISGHETLDSAFKRVPKSGLEFIRELVQRLP